MTNEHIIAHCGECGKPARNICTLCDTYLCDFCGVTTCPTTQGRGEHNDVPVQLNIPSPFPGSYRRA